MAIYVEVNGTKYPATITGRLNDGDWDNRSSKYITVGLSYEEANNIFMNNTEWNIVQDIAVEKETGTDENGDPIFETVTETESFDNSEYCIAGDIVDHRNGTVTVKMGKPTAEELLSILIGGMDE